MSTIRTTAAWVPAAFLLLLASSCQKEIFVECESFENKGGWVVDPQFVEQMGSPYLLAHGMGRPVENASTSVRIPSSGTYYVWARTTDWAPGHWAPPGRFRIRLGEGQLPETMGYYKGWGWNYAGKVRVRSGQTLLQLEDLTGFDGRCDAIYISNRFRTPTNQPDYLQDMRDRFTGNAGDPQKIMDFDLVVVGGGLAGCAAAMTAAEQGLRVALVHDRPVLGGNASSEIRVHTLGDYGYFERILKKLDTEHYPNGSPEAMKDEKKRQLAVESQSSISLFLNYRAYDADTAGQQISWVDARQTATGERIRFRAPYFADCTGDGWIGYWAGADYHYGREPDTLYGESWDEHGDLWSPETEDREVMGATLLWGTTEADTASEFPEVPWAMEVVGNYAAGQGTWNWEMISDQWHQVDQGELIRDHLLKAIYGSFYNEKQKDGMEYLQLEWVPYILGKRESRRLVGDYIYTFNDIREGHTFPDAVVYESREVDLHYPQKKLDESRPDFLSEAMYYPADPYQIPYRSLYSKNILNLFMAGRCFSCSHAGLGGPRVMRTTGQMGAAVGYAASLCIKHICTPRGLYEDYLEEYMDLIRSSGSVQQ